MNEHKKFQRPKKRLASLDGIVSSSQSLGAPVRKAYRAAQNQTSSSLGTLAKRPDGFQPSRSAGHLGQSAKNGDTASMLDEPLILDDIDSKPRKGHYFGRKRPRLHKFLKRASLSLVALILIGGLYFGFKFYITERHLFRGGGKSAALAEKIDINQLKGEGDGRVNILLLGIGGPGHDGADLTDTIMVASIDPVNNKVALLSVPRDLWVKIPNDGYQKINAAFTYGKQGTKAKDFNSQEKAGLDLLDKTIEPVLGININYHAIVDFAAFQQSVDAVGGVTFYVPEQLYDPTIAWENKYNPVIAQKGTQSFNGARALLYARSRETSSDFARAERQRQVLVALKDKILSAGTFSNPVKISSLLDSLGNNVYTDFTSGEINRVYQIMSKIPSNDIVSLDMVKPPHDLLTTGNMNGLSIVEPKAGLFDYTAMQSYVRNALRDGFIAKENAKVAVYNATTTAGLATTQANVLKSYGYNVTTVDNAPSQTGPAHTVIVDLSKGVDKYTRHYLEQRYSVASASSLPASAGITPPIGTNFVIILGNDATTTSQN